MTKRNAPPNPEDPERNWSAKDIPAWATVDFLESTLFDAIHQVGSSGDEDESRFAEVDTYLSAPDDAESLSERSCALVRCLSSLRPRLAELLGGPSADWSEQVPLHRHIHDDHNQ